MPPFSASRLLTAWELSPGGLLAVLVVAGCYLRWVHRARRAGRTWSRWRTALLLVLGVGTLAYAVCGPLAVYRDTVFWVGALQVGVLASLTPVGLALGDLVRLLRTLYPAGRHPLLRPLSTRLARLLMFPAVGTALAVGTLIAVFWTPAFAASTRSPVSEALLDLALVVTGLLFVLPLMVDGVLPRWATPAVRTALAFVDGLADAIPGILLMTASGLVAPTFPGWTHLTAGGVGAVSGLSPDLDQRLGGGALLAVAEAVGLPVIAAVFVEWVRSDDREAAATDRALDAADHPVTVRGAGPATGPAAGAARDPAADPDDSVAAPALWWESDPRLQGRFRPRA